MTVPTPQKLNALPKWALSAFMARCARRVLPLYRVFVRRAPEHLVAIERAVDLAEHRSALGETDEVYDNYDLHALADTLGAIREAALNTEADTNGLPLGDSVGEEAR